MGRTVLSVYGICGAFYRAGRLREYFSHDPGADRLVPPQGLRCLRRGYFCPGADDGPGLQPGTAWLDFWDFVVSNNVLPLGSLVLALFCCNRFGWGWDNFVAEANTGKGLKVRPWMKPIFRYFVPAAILFIYL